MIMLYICAVILLALWGVGAIPHDISSAIVTGMTVVGLIIFTAVADVGPALNKIADILRDRKS